MPVEHKCDDPVKSYRDYYMSDDTEIASWNKKRKKA